jgi:hypothetical protein
MADDNDKWVVMECLNAFKDANGHPGETKVPVSPAMSKAEALAEIEAHKPKADFSIRKLRHYVMQPFYGVSKLAFYRAKKLRL